ncbi:MAG: ABC transporter ATP-binding protein [Deltaproteobacteria bacterium]|nr:ABC transporter ATP-binding protein [Deltaproteobacteria bacterium]
MLLEVEDLRTHFYTEEGVVKAVDGVSFSVDKGKTLCLVGESGCGKSVTALTIMGLIARPPARIMGGEIRFDGRDLLKLTASQLREVRGNDVAMIFQDPMTSLNPVYTVGFQIAEAMQVHRPELSTSTVRARCIDLLKLVGIPEPDRRFEDYPHELSGGMRQRVMIAMALACDPKVLIADEPTTALDVTIQAQILALIRRLQTELGMAVILITHDLGIVSEMADEVVVMYAGKVIERAAMANLFGQPLHPYTKGLLDSIPILGSSVQSTKSRLRAIGGSVPSLSNLPPGCRFQDRCQLVKPHCRQAEPNLETKRTGHLASCYEVSVATTH